MNVREAQPIDIAGIPELIRIVDEVRMTNQPRILTRGDEEVAVLMPPSRKRARVSRKRGYLTADDPFWNIVGMSEATEGPTDVSENKYRYLADAYTPQEE